MDIFNLLPAKGQYRHRPDGRIPKPEKEPVSDAGNGYIVSKSLLKSTKKEQEWTYSDDGYTAVSEDFKYKSRVVKKTVKDENGDKRTIEEKVVAYWSRKFQARAEQENRKFLDFLKKLEEHPENFRITAVQSKSLRKFFKKECVNEKIGEILDSLKLRAFVDLKNGKQTSFPETCTGSWMRMTLT